MAKGDTDPIWTKRLRQKPRNEKSARIQKILKKLEVSQWWDPEIIAARQFEQMSQLLTHAQNTIPHYT